MRYVGSAPSAFGEDRKKYVVGSGGVNAGDTVFNVSYDEGKVDAYLNGIRLFPDTDFTKTANGVGSNITLASGVGAGDVLELFGLQGVHAGNGLVEDRFVVGTGSTGSGGSYTNSTTVFPSASNVGDTVSVWRNGVKLVHTTDYTVQPAASTVTLGSAATAADEICIQVVGIVTSANFIPTAGLLDEDNFSSNSATKPASQQSIKAYVDTADALKANVANTNMTGTATGVNLTLSGNLTVNGSTVTADTTNTVIKDNLIGLNNGVTSNANDAGLIIERGSTGNDALIMWDESEDKWTLGTSTSTSSSTGNLNITAGTLVANLEGNVTGTIQTAAQANITSVGTLTSATISGDFTVDTSTLKVDSSNNRVGIGNNSPDVLLDIGDSSSGSAGVSGRQVLISDDIATVYDSTDTNTYGSGIKINNADATSNRTSTGITFEHRTSSSGVAGIFSTSAAADRADLRFVTRGSSGIDQRMMIDDSGNVGIGASSPSSFDSAGNQLVVGSGTGHQGLTINSGSSNTGVIHFADGTTGNESYRGYIYYPHNTDKMEFGTAASTRMTIDSSGKVGIGTGSPDANILTGITSGSNNANIYLGATGTGNAEIVLDGSNGDFSGSDYFILRQISSSLNVENWIGTSGDFIWSTAAGTERMKIASAGDVTVSTGNIVIGTAGKGIDFSAQTQSTSYTASSEVLDHYEEGDWTPGASSAGGSSSVTYYGTPSGKYTRIGNVCFFRGSFYINATGSHSGKPRITGLPFTTVGTGTMHIGYWYGLSGSSSLVNYSGTTAGTYIEVFAITGATISSNGDRVDASALWTNKPEIMFSGFYFV